MIETSTSTTNSFQNDMVQHTAIPETLGEEEQYFYDSIKTNMDSIVSSPGTDVIARILKYSKSL